MTKKTKKQKFKTYPLIVLIFRRTIFFQNKQTGAKMPCKLTANQKHCNLGILISCCKNLGVSGFVKICLDLSEPPPPEGQKTIASICLWTFFGREDPASPFLQSNAWKEKQKRLFFGKQMVLKILLQISYPKLSWFPPSWTVLPKLRGWKIAQTKIWLGRPGILLVFKEFVNLLQVRNCAQTYMGTLLGDDEVDSEADARGEGGEQSLSNCWEGAKMLPPARGSHFTACFLDGVDVCCWGGGARGKPGALETSSNPTQSQLKPCKKELSSLGFGCASLTDDAPHPRGRSDGQNLIKKNDNEQ